MDNQAFTLLMEAIKDIKHDIGKIDDTLTLQNKVLSDQAIVLIDHTRRSTSNEIHILRVEDMVKMLTEDQHKLRENQKHFQETMSRLDKWLNVLKPTPKKITSIAAAVGTVVTFFTSIKHYIINILTK